MSDSAYSRLAKHLDGLPGGFPPSGTDAHLRLLMRLFTPEEAGLAVHLTMEQEDADTIASRAGLPAAETRQRLAGMAHKGLVFSVQPATGPPRYQAVPWVVGIYEFQVNRLDEGMLRDLAEYQRTRTPRPASAISQLRTIPIGRSIGPQLEVLSYERVDELVEGHDHIAVTACLCRRIARMSGRGCDAPEETCLTFGTFADYYVQTGRGRAIDRAELATILKKADRANLVLQPSNSRDISFLCCCCGCCCGALKGLQAHPRPAAAVTSPFVARLESEECNGCEVCLERCQMKALASGEDHVVLHDERCIGCGLCVSVCPTGALTLARKPESPRRVTPVTLDDTWRVIAQAQAGPS